MPPFTRLLILTAAIGIAAPAHAQDTSRPVDIHGFGTWAYGRTTDNNYLNGTPEGDYRRSTMALNLSKIVNDKLAIHTQAEIAEDKTGTVVELDFAFAEYALADWLSLRVGQVKHPFGIYTEVFGVGTLHPFLALPQAFYGPVGFAGKSYKGVGIAGHVDLGEWTAAYDLYGGGNELHKLATPEEYYNGRSLQNAASQIELQSTRDVIGGRLVLRTPIQGLSFGGSSYTGILNEPAANRRTVVAGQIGYRTNALTLESELAHEKQVNDEIVTGGYALAAYRLSQEWQVGAQYGDLKNTFFGVDPSAASSLQHHRESAFVVSHWFSRVLVFKAEYHLVNGNRFAMPDAPLLVDVISTGRLHTTTHLVQFGAQFAF
ncbi:MAG: hypothetical protein ABJE10_03730 [bacterium]